MIQYLGRLLARTRGPFAVSYLSKAEGEPAWRDGRLLSIDPQGACFETGEGPAAFIECLPWGSIGAVRIRTVAPAPPENG